MSRKSKVKQNRARRKARVRSVVHGTKERPRLSVYVSNKHVHAQIINDDTGVTLVSSTTDGKDFDKTMTEKAEWVGKDIAKKAKKDKIKTVVFDRGGKQFHGRLKTLADTARKEGLEF